MQYDSVVFLADEKAWIASDGCRLTAYYAGRELYWRYSTPSGRSLVFEMVDATDNLGSPTTEVFVSDPLVWTDTRQQLTRDEAAVFKMVVSAAVSTRSKGRETPTWKVDNN